MTAADLKNRFIRFDPEIDLESVAELPARHCAGHRTKAWGKCSSVRKFQDSHGWCFYVHADDSRKYLIELLYAATEGDASNWVLTCSRCAGLRAWEWFWNRHRIWAESGRCL